MKFSIRSSRLASVGLASVIAVGVIGVGSVAMAQGPAGGDGQSSREHRPVKLGFTSLVKDSGVTKEELKEGAQAGLTLGAIIDEYGDVSAAEAKAGSLEALSTHLDAAVAEGSITQEQADQLEANAPALLDRLLASVPGQHRDGQHQPRPGLRILKHAFETVSEVLGVEPSAIRDALADGGTIAGLAGDQTDEVIAALIEDANTAIDKAVADGKLPADQAGQAKERAANAIKSFVNDPHPRAGGGQ